MQGPRAQELGDGRQGVVRETGGVWHGAQHTVMKAVSLAVLPVRRMWF